MKVLQTFADIGIVIQDNPDENPHPPDLAPPDQASEANGQDAVAGTPPGTVEVDVELGERGRTRSQQAPSTSAASPDDVGAESVEQEEGAIASQSRTVKQNVMVGFALLNPSCTSLFTADSPSHALYMGSTSLSIGVSLFLCYAGGRMPRKVQDALLMVSTVALLGALSMVGAGASLQHGELF